MSIEIPNLIEVLKKMRLSDQCGIAIGKKFKKRLDTVRLEKIENWSSYEDYRFLCIIDHRRIYVHIDDLNLNIGKVVYFKGLYFTIEKGWNIGGNWSSERKWVDGKNWTILLKPL